jgi:hypothetical protein
VDNSEATWKKATKCNKECFKSENYLRAKGQLISKYLFGIFNSPKRRTKNLNFSTMVHTSNPIVFVRFLGEFKTPKRCFVKLTDLYMKKTFVI